MGLSGSIPPELGSLRRVDQMYLYNNKLSGTIPPELGSLSSAVYLTLFENQISGTIPHELGSLSSLMYLRASDNQISGTIPHELGSSSWLLWLHLDRNQLSGTIPYQLGSLSSLSSLSLFINQLSGTIPDQLGSMSNMRDLILASNQLSGTIPHELGSLSLLGSLHLFNNQLSGTIPHELGSLSSLQWLRLQGMKLSGSIPPELGSLGRLKNLYAGNNQLSGTISHELGSLSSLEHLFLNDNQLSGSIPSELGSLHRLVLLYLHNNQLSGTILHELGSLSSLQDLYLNDNQLSGSIPPELGSLRNLKKLFLAGNQLSGSIPVELTSSSTLTEVDLSNNNLWGTIPPEVASMPALTALYLNINQLSGTIPHELGSLSSLQDLYLNDNQLSGSIPPELGSLGNLKKLYLNRNQLAGIIPSNVGLILSLEIMAVEGNPRICGPDPAGKTLNRTDTWGLTCPVCFDTSSALELDWGCTVDVPICVDSNTCEGLPGPPAIPTSPPTLPSSPPSAPPLPPQPPTPTAPLPPFPHPCNTTTSGCHPRILPVGPNCVCPITINATFRLAIPLAEFDPIVTKFMFDLANGGLDGLDDTMQVAILNLRGGESTIADLAFVPPSGLLSFPPAPFVSISMALRNGRVTLPEFYGVWSVEVPGYTPVCVLPGNKTNNPATDSSGPAVLFSQPAKKTSGLQTTTSVDVTFSHPCQGIKVIPDCGPAGCRLELSYNASLVAGLDRTGYAFRATYVDTGSISLPENKTLANGTVLNGTVATMTVGTFGVRLTMAGGICRDAAGQASGEGELFIGGLETATVLDEQRKNKLEVTIWYTFQPTCGRGGDDNGYLRTVMYLGDDRPQPRLISRVGSSTSIRRVFLLMDLSGDVVKDFNASAFTVTAGKVEDNFTISTDHSQFEITLVLDGSSTATIYLAEGALQNLAGMPSRRSNILYITHTDTNPIALADNTVGTTVGSVLGLLAVANMMSALFSSLGLLTPLVQAGTTAVAPMMAVTGVTAGLPALLGHLQMVEMTGDLNMELPDGYRSTTNQLSWLNLEFGMPWGGSTCGSDDDDNVSAPAAGNSTSNGTDGVVVGVVRKAWAWVGDNRVETIDTVRPDQRDPNFIEKRLVSTAVCGWDIFLQVLLWASVLIIVGLVLHILCIKAWQWQFPETATPEMLLFPRAELYLVFVIIPPLTQAGAFLISEHKPAAVAIGVVVLLIGPGTFLYFSLRNVLIRHVFGGTTVHFKHSLIVPPIRPEWVRPLERVWYALVGVPMKGCWHDVCNRETVVARFGPLFENFKGPHLGVGPLHPSIDDEGGCCGNGVGTERLGGYLRTSYGLIELLKKVLLSFLLGVFGPAASSNESVGHSDGSKKVGRWVQVATGLFILLLQLIILVREKPFINRFVQAAETLAVTCEVQLFVILLFLVGEWGNKSVLSNALIITMQLTILFNLISQVFLVLINCMSGWAVFKRRLKQAKTRIQFGTPRMAGKRARCCSNLGEAIRQLWLDAHTPYDPSYLSKHPGGDLLPLTNSSKTHPASPTTGAAHTAGIAGSMDAMGSNCMQRGGGLLQELREVDGQRLVGTVVGQGLDLEPGLGTGPDSVDEDRPHWFVMHREGDKAPMAAAMQVEGMEMFSCNASPDGRSIRHSHSNVQGETKEVHKADSPPRDLATTKESVDNNNNSPVHDRVASHSSAPQEYQLAVKTEGTPWMEAVKDAAVATTTAAVAASSNLASNGIEFSFSAASGEVASGQSDQDDAAMGALLDVAIVGSQDGSGATTIAADRGSRGSSKGPTYALRVNGNRPIAAHPVDMPGSADARTKSPSHLTAQGSLTSLMATDGTGKHWPGPDVSGNSSNDGMDLATPASKGQDLIMASPERSPLPDVKSGVSRGSSRFHSRAPSLDGDNKGGLTSRQGGSTGGLGESRDGLSGKLSRTGTESSMEIARELSRVTHTASPCLEMPPGMPMSSASSQRRLKLRVHLKISEEKFWQQMPRFLSHMSGQLALDVGSLKVNAVTASSHTIAAARGAPQWFQTQLEGSSPGSMPPQEL
eukprot:jgi/Mesvir1/3417/Mv11921-RA.4